MNDKIRNTRFIHIGDIIPGVLKEIEVQRIKTSASESNFNRTLELLGFDVKIKNGGD